MAKQPLPFVINDSKKIWNGLRLSLDLEKIVKESTRVRDLRSWNRYQSTSPVCHGLSDARNCRCIFRSSVRDLWLTWRMPERDQNTCLFAVSPGTSQRTFGVGYKKINAPARRAIEILHPRRSEQYQEKQEIRCPMRARVNQADRRRLKNLRERARRTIYLRHRSANVVSTQGLFKICSVQFFARYCFTSQSRPTMQFDAESWQAALG